MRILYSKRVMHFAFLGVVSIVAIISLIVVQQTPAVETDTSRAGKMDVLEPIVIELIEPVVVTDILDNMHPPMVSLTEAIIVTDILDVELEACVVSPTTIDFGGITLGNSADEIFTIINTRSDTLIGIISESCPHFHLISGDGPYELLYGDTQTVVVRYYPTAIGLHTCTIETGIEICSDVFCVGAACVQPQISLIEYATVSHNAPLWTVRVKIQNSGPGEARNVTAIMNEEIPWLTIPDPLCFYGDIPEDETSWGEPDQYTFDLTNHAGGSFNIWFDVTYEDSCGNQYQVRLDPEFKPGDEHQDPENAVTSYRLSQNFPNPFNPNTNISFQIPVAGHVYINIYDVSGKLVRTLVDEHKERGLHAVGWDGKDNNSNTLATGVYFYRLQAGSYSETRKMVLLQ